LLAELTETLKPRLSYSLLTLVPTHRRRKRIVRASRVEQEFAATVRVSGLEVLARAHAHARVPQNLHFYRDADGRHDRAGRHLQRWIHVVARRGQVVRAGGAVLLRGMEKRGRDTRDTSGESRGSGCKIQERRDEERGVQYL
jgi:hypothetical protein